MDPSTIHNLLQHTYHQDQAIRVQAELELAKGTAAPGFSPALLQFLVTPGFENSSYQAGSIFFKNLVKKHWDSVETSNINDNDKSFIRGNLLNAIAMSPPQVRAQLTWTLGHILSCDYPSSWEDFPAKCAELLHSNDFRSVFAGFVSLQQLVHIYQWRSTESRAPLNKIVRVAFPTLLSYSESLVDESISNLDAALMLKTAFKAYFGAINYDFPKSLQEETNLIRWCTLFVRAIEKEIPASVLPSDKKEIGKNIWWKVKKWALRSIEKIYSRYGNPSLDTFRGDSYKVFGKRFMVKFAPSILSALLAFVNKMVTSHQHIPEKVMFRLISFFTESIKSKNTWTILQPHLESLITSAVFPILHISEEDIELWDDDPVEFVHKKMDIWEDFQSPLSACTDFLITLATDRGKTMFLPMLQMINEILTRNPVTSGGNASIENAIQRDGALSMLTILVNSIVSEGSPVRDQIPQVMGSHVLPELQSSFPFLRARACQVLTAFCREVDDGIVFPEGSGILPSLVEPILKLMGKPHDLPIRVNAALLLEQLLQKPGVHEVAVRHVALVMQELLTLTNEIDMDTLTSVMEQCVEQFPNEVAPFAISLCASLRDTFLRIMEESQNAVAAGGEDFDWDETGDKTMAAMGILKTINTLVLSIPENSGAQTELLESLQDTLLPCVTFVLTGQVIDLFDDVFELLDTCTYQLKKITPSMWNILELLFDTIEMSAIDFVEDALPSIDNFISFGAPVFESNQALQHKTVNLVRIILSSESLGDTEKIVGFKIIESLLLNCKSGMQQYFPIFMEDAFRVLVQPKIPASLFVHALEVVINCLYHDPQEAIRLLEQTQKTTPFFSLWCQSFGKLIRVHDKKLSVVAILKLINFGSSQISAPSFPESLRETWPALMKILMNMFETLPKAIEAREELKNALEHTEESEDESGMTGEETTSGQEITEDDDEYEFDESEFLGAEDDGADEEAEYLEYLSRKNAAEDYEDEEEDWCQEVGEELYYESPLEKVDVYKMFHEIVSSLSQTSPEAYALLTSHMTAADQELANRIVTIAMEKAPQVN